MKIEDFAVACYNDILKDINEWAKWDTDEMTENEIKGNRAKITRRLRLIKAIFTVSLSMNVKLLKSEWLSSMHSTSKSGSINARL